jgi:hypothetical protein
MGGSVVLSCWAPRAGNDRVVLAGLTTLARHTRARPVALRHDYASTHYLALARPRDGAAAPCCTAALLAGYRVARIAEMIGVKAVTVHGWKRRDAWDKGGCGGAHRHERLRRAWRS